ncbi:acid phosphatase type 7 [Oratosquilla oratoria]|uniref:acid phosphatase type 7 n=1 Tax=Oratosquilla oratoria TaxID=337810 RepID=UPI003F767443
MMRQGVMWAAIVLFSNVCFGIYVLDIRGDPVEMHNLGADNWQPEQIHIAYGETINEMVITWNTRSEAESVVKYGKWETSDQNDIHSNWLTFVENGTATKFVDGGFLHLSQWIHRVHLTDLEPDTRYVYHVGSEDGWSEIFFFKTMKEGTDWPVNVVMYGDMGAANPQSLARLQEEAEEGKYDAVIHVGDFAYDMHSGNAMIGDEFMRQIQPIAAYVPYMTCPGNHEFSYNFSNYRSRFSMPNYEDTESLFFSFDMGPIHFISVNTEAYYFLQYGLKPLSRQYQWLIEDLEEATKPEVREKRPWIILFGHRPMYCSNSDHDDCTHVDCLTRVGLPVIKMYAMEPLLDKYGVDLAVWAHEHSYERLWPIYNYEVLNGSYEEPYTNPRGPVHIISGSAGCKEKHDHFMEIKPEWSAFRSIDYGYTRVSAVNKTHLYFEQVSDDQDGKVIDSGILIRHTHESYAAIRERDSESEEDD